MFSSEWPLILFTLLVQMSVGTFLFLGILHDVSFVKLDERIFTTVSNHLLKLISVILLLALIVAFFHLGSPINAINALNNIESSWLSREILSIILFAISGGIFLIIYKYFTKHSKLIFNFGLFTTILGFIAIASMSMIYMLQTVPVWNNLFTPISFYLSVLILGSGVIFYSLIRIINRGLLLNGYDESLREKLNFTLNFLLVTITFLLLLNLVLTFAQIIYLGTGSESIYAGYSLIIKENLFFVITKVILLVILLTLSFRFIKKYRVERSLLSLHQYSTFYFISILLIELIGRYLFYASYHRIGV